MNQTSVPQEATADELKAFLSEKALERWTIERKPYLLSEAAPHFRELGKQFRSLLVNDVTLTRWAETHGDGLFSVVRHPVQKAKVGIIPAGEVYNFPEPITAQPATTAPEGASKEALRHRRLAVLKFFETISSLPDEDLEKIHIPVSVIAKLMK